MAKIIDNTRICEKTERFEGKIYKNDINDFYIVAKTDSENYCLVGLERGNRWVDSCSKKEVEEQILNEGFILIENATLTISNK